MEKSIKAAYPATRALKNNIQKLPFKFNDNKKDAECSQVQSKNLPYKFKPEPEQDAFQIKSQPCYTENIAVFNSDSWKPKICKEYTLDCEMDNIQHAEIKLEVNESAAKSENFDVCQYEHLKIENEELIIKEEEAKEGEEEEKVSIIKIGTLADLPKFLTYTQSLNNTKGKERIKQDDNRKKSIRQDNTKTNSWFQNTQTIYKSEFKNLNLQPVKYKSPKVVTQFKCDLCEYATAYEVNLKVHRVAHKYPGDNGIFKCDNCKYVTNCKTNLMFHRLGHNPKLKCGTCEYATDYQSNLKMHQLKHKRPEEVLRFKCEQCEFSTIWKSSLKIHLLKHKNGGKSQN